MVLKVAHLPVDLRSRRHAAMISGRKAGGFMRSFRNSLVFAALLTVSLVSVPAQEKFTTPLLPREALFGSPKRADPQISPDGTQRGDRAPFNGDLNVWIRTLGKTDDRAGTDRKRRDHCACAQ